MFKPDGAPDPMQRLYRSARDASRSMRSGSGIGGNSKILITRDTCTGGGDVGAGGVQKRIAHVQSPVPRAQVLVVCHFKFARRKPVEYADGLGVRLVYAAAELDFAAIGKVALGFMVQLSGRLRGLIVVLGIGADADYRFLLESLMLLAPRARRLAQYMLPRNV